MFCKHCNLRQTNTLSHRCSHKLALILYIHNSTKQKMHHQHTLNWAYHVCKTWPYSNLTIKNERLWTTSFSTSTWNTTRIFFPQCFNCKSYKMPLWKTWIFIQAKIIINCSTKSTYHIALLMCIFPVRGKYKWQAGMGHDCRALRSAKRFKRERKAINPKTNKQKDVKVKGGDFAGFWVDFTVAKAEFSIPNQSFSLSFYPVMFLMDSQWASSILPELSPNA